MKKKNKYAFTIEEQDSEDSSLIQYSSRNYKNFCSEDKMLILLLKITFFFSLINLVYDFIIILKIFRPIEFINYKQYCNYQSEMSVFLDMILSCSLLLMVNYFLEVIDKNDFGNQTISTIYFSGFFIFWVGIKTISFIVYTRNCNCIFSNIFETIFYLLSLRNNIFVFVLYFFESFYFLSLFIFFKKYLNKKQRKIIDFLD